MRKLLLAIDMQNDFIDDARGTPEAAAIVDRVVEEIGKYPPENIIATRDTQYWAADISEISAGDTVLIIGAGPTGVCTLQYVLLKEPKQVIVCERDSQRRAFIQSHYPQVLTVGPEDALEFVRRHSAHGGADAVLDVAGNEETFRLAWECARSNAVVTVVALYDGPQILPLPEMYSKNLTFKTDGVDGCQCAQTAELIEQSKIDTTPLITHTYPLTDIAAAYELFEQRLDGVIKVAIKP